jgi:Rps23 Pro-64 3,4-dihydroxylase Tpa1-like proline 4-hydroxylase
MAHPVCWHMTQLPTEIIEIIENDIMKYNFNIQQSKVVGSELNQDIRNSKNAWISTSHWIGGWLWYYIDKINRENFCYDLTDIDGGTLQYTHYSEGEYYGWHTDQDVGTYYKPKTVVNSMQSSSEDNFHQQGEYVRKLSFTLQLSDPEDYGGGEVQFINSDNQTFFAPKQKGTIIVFDSRVRHRVRKVKFGTRKSIVGWCVGPRWK